MSSQIDGHGLSTTFALGCVLDIFNFSRADHLIRNWYKSGAYISQPVEFADCHFTALLWSMKHVFSKICDNDVIEKIFYTRKWDVYYSVALMYTTTHWISCISL